MKKNVKARFISILMILFSSLTMNALNLPVDSTSTPEIYYSSPQKYTIADITVSGIKHYEAGLLINISGLQVGQVITIPGDDISNAIKKFWSHGLFSDVTISATKIEGAKIWLNIDLKERPRLSMINYHGLKKSEREEIEKSIAMIKGSQVTPNLINRTEQIITSHFVEKGFHNVEVNIVQRDDNANENQLIIDIYVDKKEKVKVNNLYISGNKVLSYNKVNRAMKKTNAKRIVNLFRTKKFIDEEFENDKAALIEKYNELGYRDAIIVADSVVPGDQENTVDVYLSVEEGRKYYFGEFSWVGNTKYPSDVLQHQLRIEPGDVYNQTLLNERLEIDEDAVGSIYSDNGYLFYNLTPVEVAIVDDSLINLEMRIQEGPQATLNNIIIQGNTKTNEQVARRELRVKPGQLFSKSALMRSVRELSQLGHFDPETLGQNLEVIPNAEDATVDLVFNVDEKANDQIELSGGWGAGMFVGTLGLSFNNFSIQNFFDKDSWKPLPSGDGQSLSLRAQTNGKYYQNYSISFREPWLGGKRPNSLSVSAYRSIQTGVSSNYGYYGGYGYSSYGSDYSSYYPEYDDSKHLNVSGFSVGLGKRLSWPDDYFTLYEELSYQHYDILNWYFLGFETGKSNILSFTTSLTRSSIDNPIYTRRGSTFSFSLQLTPPYSLFNDLDYNDATDAEKYKFIEYHKWKLKAQSFTPLSNDAKLVLMSRAEYGFLGYYNEDARSPFEKFNLGGDGLSGYNLYGSETVGLRGYENGALTYYSYDSESGSWESQGNIYTRLTMELRYPLMLEASSTIYALAFVEAGRSWGDFKDFNPFELKRSAGAGVRIFLPMFGMMGIDWAYGFDPAEPRAGTGANGSQFHFIIGQQF